MSIKHLFKAVALITVFNIITRVFGFLFRIYLSRELGAQLLGFYTIATSFFAVLSSFVSSGIPLAVSKQTSQFLTQGKSQKQIGALTFCGIVLSVVFSLIAIVFVFVFKGLISKSGNIVFNLLLIMLPSVVFGGIYGAVRGNFWGYKNFFAVCITEFIEQIVRILLCFVFIFAFPNQDKVLSVAQSFSVAIFISCIITLIYYFKNKQTLSSGKGFYKDMLKSSLPISFVRFFGSFIQPIISVIIPLRLVKAGLTQADAVASLGVSLGMVFPLFYLPGTIVGSLAMALIPDFSSSHAQGKKDELAKKVKSALLFCMLISFFVCVLFFAVGQEIGIVLYKNAEAGQLLKIGAIIMVPMSLNNITSAILNSLGMETKSMKNYFLSSLLLLICLWFLPGVVGGGQSLIVGMGLCTTLSSLLNIKMIQKTLQCKVKYKKDFFVLLAFFLLAGVIGTNLYTISKIIMPNFIASVLAGIIAWVIFVALIWAFNFVDVKSYFKKSKQFLFGVFKNKKHQKSHMFFL